MARVVANLPAELDQVAAPPGPDDELLTASELGVLSIFESLQKTPLFKKFPGSTLLRKCQRGRVICEQGAAGATAFAILTTNDVIKLREIQVQAIRDILAAKVAGRKRRIRHPFFQILSTADLQRREQEYLTEVEKLRSAAEEAKRSENRDNLDLDHRATAFLLVDLEDHSAADSVWRRAVRMLTGRRKRSHEQPKWIPIDGANIDSNTRSARLYEGALFGEMSCINRTPRAATVIAEHDCYVLEMLRNVLDTLHKDPVYKERMDATYRERVLELHIRRLSIFESLTDSEFDRLRDSIELIEVPSGRMIFEEFDPSDSVYVVRSGLVKVVANAWTQFRVAEFSLTQWASLAADISDSEFCHSHDVRIQVVNAISQNAREAAARLAAAEMPSATDQHVLLDGLNQFIRQGIVHEQFGKTKGNIADAVGSETVSLAMSDFPDDPDHWSDLEVRTFHRLLLEHVFPTSLPRRIATAGPRRTLSYRGLGEYFGEMGVMTGEPRSATIYAYDHPDSGVNQSIPDSRTGAVPSRVELVRISRDAFEQLVASSPPLQAKVEQVIVQRRKVSAATQPGSSVVFRASPAQSQEFEQLGLIQGQQLMLIDLDRCTRCDECVQACVTAHKKDRHGNKDGRSRLYLDGPRFGNYLVPITCRSCLDPVCMIGCPVGSINRGERGEIVIENWCIGCTTCEDQCPYGSIRRHPLTSPVELSLQAIAMLGPDTAVKCVEKQAVVCDLCSSLPSQEPACVYACPHDAAIRVNAQDFFLGSPKR